MKNSLTIRLFTPADIPDVMEIQRACYPAGLLEDAVHLLAKQQSSPASCWVACKDDQVSAYLLTHPWAGDAPPDLNTPLPAIPSAKPHHYLHDLAVHPRARGLRLAQLLIDTARHWGRQAGYSQLRLVAVAGAGEFWLKQGFNPVRALSPDIIQKLARYGPDTQYLAASI